MANEYSANTLDGKVTSVTFPSFGETARVQRELLQTYERLSRVWLERLQAEVAIRTGLAGDLASRKSAADAMRIYTDRMTRQFRMSAEDGRHILSDCQEIVRKISRVDGEDAQVISDSETEDGPAAESRITH